VPIIIARQKLMLLRRDSTVLLNLKVGSGDDC